MNQQILQGRWQEFKGEMRKLWGDLTDNELEQTHGNVAAIGGLIGQKYGQMKEDLKARFDSLVERYGSDANKNTEQAKENLRKDVYANENRNKH